MSNVVLHCNNVCWLGGTMLNTLTYVKAYPELHHEVISFSDVDINVDVWQALQMAGAHVSFVRKLTPEIVKTLDPFVIFLKNTGRKHIEGDPKWLLKWPLVYSHHSLVRPPIKCEHRIFNSHYLAGKYGDTLKGMHRDVRFIGSLIDTRMFSTIPRDHTSTRCVIGKVSSDHPDKFPGELRDILHRVHTRHPEAKFMVVGAGKYWPTKTSEWCWMPGVGTKPVKEFYAACDIFVYRNKENLSETWGRTVTEAMAAGLPVVAECRGALPEQVDHGVNGFVCETDAEFVKHLSYLVENPDARYEMGLAARTKAIEQFDVLTLRRRTSDIMLQSAVECVDGRVL